LEGGEIFPALIPELKMEIEHKMWMNAVKICNTTSFPPLYSLMGGGHMQPLVSDTVKPEFIVSNST
jgi:hypothetical protein